MDGLRLPRLLGCVVSAGEGVHVTALIYPPEMFALPEVTRTITELDYRLNADRTALNRNDAYLRGEHPLGFMQPLIKEKLDSRILPMVANFCEFVTETYEARLDIEGFEFQTAENASVTPETLWQAWQASDMDENASMAHFEALGLGRGYYVVGDGESSDDLPSITVESALQMIEIRSPRTRKVESAGKFWTENEGKDRWCGLWTPEFDATYRWRGGWVEDWRDDHERGSVSVVPLVCKPRTLDRRGRSIFSSLLPISDGLNKTLTDMMMSMEFHAIPRRWATGLNEDDFKDDNGNDVNVFKLMAEQVWAVESKEARFGQFSEADLKNFHDSAKMLIKMIGMLCALPGHTTAFDTTNPPSADSMRSAENDFVKREERIARTFGGSAEELMRHVALRMNGGTVDPALRLMETKWRDPATPTVAQKADAVVKKFTAGIIPKQQARIDLDYSPEQLRAMEAMDRAEAEAYFAVPQKPMSAEVGDAVSAGAK